MKIQIVKKNTKEKPPFCPLLIDHPIEDTPQQSARRA